jgi:hypothetical protein
MWRRALIITARKRDIPKEKGMVMMRARKEVTRVPTMNGKAPNSLVMGFQMSLTRKEKPKALMEGRDITTMVMNPPVTKRRTRVAMPLDRSSKIQSPHALFSMGANIGGEY